MKYEVLPKSNNILYLERELNISHTAFEYEYRLFNEIKAGNVKNVERYFDEYINSGFVMGYMSDNNLRQLRYWAVSGIAVAVHYAILGGADETDTFNLSDECIRYVDTETDEEKLISFLREKLIKLTLMVYSARMQGIIRPEVRRCIHYIHINLHKKITMDELAKECLVSKGYLESIFKNEMGMTIMNYIRIQRIEAAELRLREGIEVGKVAYEFGFCSETHFIESYKKVYGYTPGYRVKKGRSLS